MSDYILTTDHLSKKYGSSYAVKEIGIHVRRGDIYGLIGPNGAGKTTLMKMISGFTKPTDGSVSLCWDADGQRRIGVLIEAPGLYENMNAFENLRLKAVALGVYDKQALLDIIDFVGLADAKKKKIKHYSLGMRQRLGIGMALIGTPDLLILDEPINGLDPQGIMEVRNLIIRLNREKNMTILISSHILEELEKVASVFGIINKGTLLMELTEQQLKEKCREKVEIITPDTEKAAVILEQMGIQDFVVTAADTIRAYGCTDRIEEISTNLVISKVGIRSITALGTTLEEFFLQVTGENGGKA